MKVSTKLKAFSGLSNNINFNQARILLNAVIMSNFNYCPLIWLFCSKAANSTIECINVLSGFCTRILNPLLKNFYRGMMMLQYM